jgi:hypothetical protein
MLIDSPMTPQEEVATAAWDDYALAAQRAQAAWGDSRYTSNDRRRMHERVIDAQARFADAYRLLHEPTPEPLRLESGRLYAEGVALLSLIGLFVVLFLPDLEEHFWPLMIAIAGIASLGGWTTHYCGRLGRHLGRRL